MPKNDFLPFATRSTANVVEQDEYSDSAFVKEGFVSGLAKSAEINKAIRQGTSIASAVAQFIADNTGNDVLDNGDVSAIVTLLNSAVGNISGAHIAVASGTADAITATFSPALTALTNGLVVYVRAANANASISPTFNPDSLGALPIVKGANLPLKDGDIGGSGYWMILQYDQEFNKWVLQNPAKGISPLSGIPIGTIEYFGTSAAPTGYLIANGAAVGRTTYPELFAAIGTAFGEGDGSTTFNLPDLIGRFAQGSNTPGQKIEAGLPNIEGQWNRSKTRNIISSEDVVSGAFDKKTLGIFQTFGDSSDSYSGGNLTFNASRSNPIYGASSTVQPPALTLLPCIKAFDAATNPGLIDMTALAQEMADKTDKMAAAHAAMPSDRYVDLTPPAAINTETNYTAIDDGYVALRVESTAAGQGVYVGTYQVSSYSVATSTGHWPSAYVPVSKGGAFAMQYTGGTVRYCRFYYANGSVQQ